MNETLSRTDTENLCRTLNLNIKDIDILIAADGSGTTVEKAGAWAYIMYWPTLDKFKCGMGTVSNGTNNYVELAPYLHALWYYHYTQPLLEKRLVKVEIVSDSELTVKQGNGDYSINGNLIQWAGIQKAKQMGYSIHWNHVPRNSNPFSSWCDKTAGDLRKNLQISIDNAKLA